jgi:chromosomal replication initiator protein
VSTELPYIWSRIQAELAGTLDESTYRIWLEPLRARELTEEHLLLDAPPQTCSWIQERFGAILQSAVTKELGPTVVVEVAQREQGAEPQRPSARASSAQAPAPRAEPELLGNPKLTFSQFVIGDCNRLAHAAALAVAEMPAQAYNPLFICGPPGVGKTHLLRAIAALLASHSPELILRVSTGETFTNEFLSALNDGRLEDFKARFRDVDVLLIDDIQFLERKARTEEEFFHTFNWLHDVGSQLVLTSDRPPSDLQALEDRLRERFQAGLVADIRPPDSSTRLAILRKRVQHDNVALAEEAALSVISERVTLNVRALEGALIRVVAFSSLTGRPLTAELAGEVLDGLYPTPPGTAARAPRSLSDIQQAACRQFGITQEQLVSSSRAPRISWARQVAMYAARKLTSESLPSIGRQFGGRDHTTVLHACRRAGERMANDADCQHDIQTLLASLSKESLDRKA